MSYFILQGDVLEQLRAQPANSVHCGITSPRPIGACAGMVNRAMSLGATHRRLTGVQSKLIGETL